MSLININNLTFAYPGSYDNIFENVSFQIDTNWKLGFTGRNGRGKTTFLNLLLGKYEYNGSISASVLFEYFPFEIVDKKMKTINAVNSICSDYKGWELLRELSLMQVSEDVMYRPFGTLSNGEQTKVLLAALFLRENSFLLIDEPTNHLDIYGRKIVSEYLKSKSGFILVSHDRCFLDECVDHILSINKSNIEIERGNFSSWFINKDRRDKFELAENEKLKKEVKRLRETAREKALWSNTAESRKIGFDPRKTEKSLNRRAFEGAKSKKAMKCSKALEKRQETAVEEKSKLLKNLEAAEELKLSRLPYHTSQLVFLDKVSISYGDNTVCGKVSFVINEGDRVLLSGRNGSGKSSIIKLICGQDIPHTGEIKIGSGLQISYVSQDTSYLKGDLSDFAKEYHIDVSLFMAILRKLDFSRIQFEKDIGNFSGGQKKKVLIAKSLCEKKHLLIWDEPLNYIDVISRIQIENLLLEYKPTILFAEHDRAFCENIATKTVNL
ncbi:MAG: ABC-F type ribosomal protection protein [Eubacteriales bacterium]|nr:ABC-F type ribosomal protection protein [Eubacteriales bacterium]